MLPTLLLNAKNFLILTHKNRKKKKNLGRQPPACCINIHETETTLCFIRASLFISLASLLRKTEWYTTSLHREACCLKYVLLQGQNIKSCSGSESSAVRLVFAKWSILSSFNVAWTALNAQSSQCPVQLTLIILQRAWRIAYVWMHGCIITLNCFIKLRLTLFLL